MYSGWSKQYNIIIGFHQGQEDQQEEKRCNSLWTDENKFVLFGSKGWRSPNTELKPQYTVKTVKHGDTSIMIWGCFSYCGVRPIYGSAGIIDQFEYIKILDKDMLSHDVKCK